MAGGQFHLDPETYLAEVRAEVAPYDELQDAVADAAAAVPARRILELGTGTGETAQRVLRRHPQAHLVGIDASAEMVRLASSELPEAEIRVGRIEDALPAGPFDLVVSALAVHHLPSEGKADLFSRLPGALRQGGRFVLADVIVPEHPEDAAIPLEPGVDLPDPLADQLEWLEAAGFECSVPWARGDLAVVVADLGAGAG